MTDEFQAALLEHQEAFGVENSEDASGRFSSYFQLLRSRNDLLHLVAPCSAEEFAVRHILESIFIETFLPIGATVVDVGSGAGLPGIPLAIFREDLNVILIESKAKKAAFLEQAAEKCGIGRRVRIINKQFGEAEVPPKCVITARALDRFPKVLPRLSKWAFGRKMILFGGPSLEDALVDLGLKYERTLIPKSEQRFVFKV
ncbi:MAG TPA: RsmG family class I SAM-dependent methyltransferase [Aridibacter sp.]|nr:RsmG family class I SAM-dependent methyltransferase [Aridibacter sp.]